MEMKEIAKHKTWKMSSSSEPFLTRGIEVSPLKKFTIPKIRRTTEKVYLSPCCTSSREYSFIHDILKHCRLDVSGDLQLTWQFGDTKLVHNEDLEKNFTAKRSEMRESGRHGRELEEHFCFLALPQSDVVEIYQNGLSTTASTLKILGNPLLGIYIFRHVDIALNYAHSRSITVESILIFKVLFGKVKKIQPSVDKNKVSLDPSPNFDCHMSRNVPSLKDTIELQAYNSVVYFYEYSVFSKPVNKPRQCLPYAIVTVKFIGQKVDNGYLMTSLRFLSTGFPKRAERKCSLNNCTVAKRIGKGKDATVIFEHFRKPIDPFVQENCSCSALTSEINPSNSDISNSYGNVQNGNISVLETYSGETENNSAEIRHTSQVHTHDSGLSFMPSNNRESGNGDLLLDLTYLKSILSSISAASPHKNIGSSTVITSKLIKDPRLTKREQSMEKQNTKTGLGNVLPFDKSLDHADSETSLSSVPTNSVSSPEIVPADHVLTNCLAAPCFRFSFEDLQSQTHSSGSEDYHGMAPTKITMASQHKDQDNFSFPISLSNVVSEVENQKYSEVKAQRLQERSNIPLLDKQSSEPHNSYELVNTCTRESRSHNSQESQPSNLKTTFQIGHQTSTVFPLQKKGSIDECLQNIGKMRLFTDPEDSSNDGEKQTWYRETDNYFTSETKVSPVGNYISSHQEYREGESLDSSGENGGKILITQELEMPKSPTSTTKDKDELHHLALELEGNLPPSRECLSQKHPQHSWEYEDGIHTSFTIAQKLMELKLEKTNQNSVNIITDDSQEAKDIQQVKELLIDTVTLSPTIETALDNSNCNITREYMCAQGTDENEPVSLQNIQKVCKETPHFEGHNHILFYNAKLNNDSCLSINVKGQGDNDKENQNEAKEEDSASSPENNSKNIYGSEKQGFHANVFTNINERRENKNYKEEILSSEEFSTAFNLIWREKDRSIETALLENEVTAIKQRDAQNAGRNVEHLASTTLPEIAGFSAGVPSTTMPVLSTNHEGHKRYQFKETWSSLSPDFGLLIKCKVSDCEIDMDKNKLQESFHPSVNENSVLLQSFELENEIEIESEQYDDAFLFQRDAHSCRNVPEEFNAFEALKSRIDWEGLLGRRNGEVEALESFTGDQHYSKKSNCVYSYTQKDKTELLNPILLPDMQVRITYIFRPGFSPTDDSLAVKDDFYKSMTESTKPEINEKGDAPGFGIYSQSSDEHSGYPYEDKSGNSTRHSGLVSKSEISHSSDLSHNTHVTQMSEKSNSESLSTEPSNVMKINESKCSFTKSKTDFNDTRNKKDMGPRISKRKLRTSFRVQNIPQKDLRQREVYGKKRWLTSQDSYERFSSLSQGRIKTFSQSERHIRSVLNILSSEASLCKSRRLSRKLDRAVLHLKKAHRRVHTSLQLIAKVGEKRKGPLPKAYAIICNNFWESCDLQDHSSSMSERRYYSTKHFLSKRKYDKWGEKRALEFDIDKSLAQVSKHRSYKTDGEKIVKCLSRNVASSISRSHATIHVRELCDIEQHCESQLPLCFTSQSTGQSEYDNSIVRNGRLSELQHFSPKTECLLYPDEKLTEKEPQIDTQLSNSKYEKLENHSAHEPIKEATKENNSEANAVINESNSVSLSCIKENNVSYSADKNYDAACIAHSGVRTGILISVLDSNVKHFLNVGVYKQDNLITSDDKRDPEVTLPVEKWTAPMKSSTPSIITGNFLMDSLNLTLIASKQYNIPQFLSTTTVTDSEGEYLEPYLDKQTIFVEDCFAASSTVSHCQQICGRKELLKTQQCSSSSCLHVDGKEADVTEHSDLDLTSETEQSKICGENIMKKPSSSDNSLPLKDNGKGSLKRRIAQKDIQDKKIRKIEQAEKDSVCKESMMEGSIIEYKNQKKILKEDSSHLNIKTIKSNLADSHLSIKNMTPEIVSLNNKVSSQLNKRKKGKVKVSNDSQSDCISKAGILGINYSPDLYDHSETSKVTTLQKKPTSSMNELKEKHSADHTALTAELSQILQRADETSSLQILEEETKVCQNILPLFVEAFERKQECSFEQILISRKLLVEQNLWNNCKHKLKPCAVDVLVELQMVMETIQFIENKKKLLKSEPTFRSLLWYDETLYSELLGRPRGYQLQSNFYPAFQARLKYNAFSELQNYHNQLVESFAESKQKNSYYAALKYKRQINECEAIMKHYSDCFDFSLSVPFTCGVNFGDSLGDLEILRKSTLKLIGMHGDSPKVDSCPGKQDHLWIIIEMITSKVNFIKSNEEVSIKICLYGLEHICFDAAKNLVWKEKRHSFSKKNSKKNKEMLFKINECAFSKLQKIYDTLSKDLNNDPTSFQLEEDTVIASRNSDDLISIENCRFSSTLLSHPGICCISEILDQAKFADLKKLQELTLRCTEHLEIFKKKFQMLQKVNIDNIFITEENVLDVLKKHNHGAVILKPAAIETYIEIVMLSETVHFLKNSMAKKLDNQRFRGMLWFDLSLLPELVHCQEKMASFSFLNDNPTDCLWEVIETAISELKKDLGIIYKYNDVVNCSYALHLFSRELKELSEIKKHLKKSECSISTYIDFVPYIASINYGNTVTELEHNYDQFSTLLKNIMSVPQKDLGKMVHIMRVMKTIEHMKIICAKNAKLTTSFILCQILHNRRNTLQVKTKEKVNVTKPEENTDKPSTSTEAPSVSECIIKNISNSSRKQPITVDKCEDTQEKENTATVSSCKKQKVSMKAVRKINRETATLTRPRTPGSHPKSENKTGSRSSDNLKRNYVSPKTVEMQRSLPQSLLPLKNLQDTYTQSESKIDLTDSSSHTSEHFTGQQEKLNGIKKRNGNYRAAETSDKKDCPFATCAQKGIDSTFSKEHKAPSHKLLKNPLDLTQKFCLSNIKPRTDDSLELNASVLPKPILHSVRDIHTSLAASDTVSEHQDNKILNLSIKDCTSTNSPEPICVQDRSSVLQVNKSQPELEEKYMKDTLNSSPVSFGASGSAPLDVTRVADHPLSDQQDEENPKVLTQKAAACWNELPQSACAPVCTTSEHSFGMSYPYYAWCVYHYSSSNGSAVTHTYQGVTSYAVQPPPGVLTTVTSTVQNIHSNLTYSEYFTYFAEQPQANAFVPGNGYFQSQMPIYYNFQQPGFSQYASQPLPHTTYPYPPNPGVLPEVPWVYAPWQQEPFQRRH